MPQADRMSATFEALDAISRTRALTSAETSRLERLMRVAGLTGERKRWTLGEKDRLRRYLLAGKRPRQIASLMGRTERAIWRKMYLEGWTCRAAEQGSIAPATRNVGR